VSWFGKIYRRNIYGVMGTLVFHILLFSVFLLADINIKGNAKEEELIIEFPDILLEAEEPEVQEEAIDDAPDMNTESSPGLTNVASNRTATEQTTSSVDDFFDDEYLKEIEAAKNLVSDVNKQISKEITDLDDIKMPVETTEGMEPDSIKNVIYTGESNIVYYLENRYHLSLPIPVYLAQGGGKVIVDIVVNQQGNVIEAISRRSNLIRDQQIYLYAETAARRTIFNEDISAPPAQTGSIHYTFIAQ
jgi:hypothetical protein